MQPNTAGSMKTVPSVYTSFIELYPSLSTRVIGGTVFRIQTVA